MHVFYNSKGRVIDHITCSGGVIKLENAFVNPTHARREEEAPALQLLPGQPASFKQQDEDLAVRGSF